MPTIIDVRTPEEYAEGHVEGAINFPLTDLANGALPGQGRSTQITLYCHSGARSEVAKKILENNGYTQVKNGGGLRDMGLVE